LSSDHKKEVPTTGLAKKCGYWKQTTSRNSLIWGKARIPWTSTSAISISLRCRPERRLQWGKRSFFFIGSSMIYCFDFCVWIGLDWVAGKRRLRPRGLGLESVARLRAFMMHCPRR